MIHALMNATTGDVESGYIAVYENSKEAQLSSV
jgi:hypothetical protein